MSKRKHARAGRIELHSLEIRRLLTTAFVDSGHILQIAGTTGNDNILVNQASNGRVTVSGVNNPDGTLAQFTRGSATGQFNQINIVGSDGNDTITIVSNVDNGVTIGGGNGNDNITGGKLNDVINGNDGSDTVDGGGGADLLVGGTGGTNHNVVNYSSRTNSVKVSFDNVANDGEANEGDNVQQMEEAWGGSNNDTFTGSSGKDYFFGNGGADSMTGGDNDDSMTGGAGQDQFFGQNGNDILEAQNNDRDTVNGGTNTDGTLDFDVANIDTLDVGGAPVQAAAPLAVVNPLASPSDLDGSYGSGGKAIGAFLGWTPQAAAVDSQGRVIYVGHISQSNGFDTGNDFAVARFDANGNLDTSFDPVNHDGQVTIDFSSLRGSGYNDDDQALGVAIGSSDSIIVVGYSQRFDRDFAVAKLTNTGAADSGFGDNGRVVVDASEDSFTDYATDAAVQADGKIVVAGDVGSEGTIGAVVRLLNNGSLDDSTNDPTGNFNGSGIANTSQNETDFDVRSVALQTLSGDGGAQRIVLGGNGNSTFTLMRFLANGTLDAGFGGSGLVQQDFSGGNFQNNLADITVDSANNIIAVGDASNFAAATAFVAQPPDPNTTHAVLAKYGPSGAAIDSIAYDSDNGFSTFGAVTVDTTGRYVAAGQDSDSFVVARYTSGVVADTGFSPSGSVLTPFSPYFNAGAFATRVLSNGKILAAGNADTPSENTAPVMARYQGSVTAPPNTEGNVTEVEGFLNYDDIHQKPPSPQVQAILDGMSPGSQFIFLSQPDSHGVPRLNLDNGDSVDDNVVISIVQGGKDGTKGDHKLVNVMINGQQNLQYDPDTTPRIEIYGNGGNDTFTIKGDVRTDLLIDGGEGNDNIQGGHGDDILIGGPGNDTVTAQEGEDIVIGGEGADNIKTDGNDDLLIAGTTSYDGNYPALEAIAAEWTAPAPGGSSSHIANIRNGGGLNGSFVLHNGAGATVLDDNVSDILDAGGGQDWLFVRLSGSNADVVKGGLGGKTIDLVGP